MKPTSAGVVLALALASGSCIPTVHGALNAFSSRFPDNNLAHVSAVYQRLPAPAPPSRPRNALGVPLVAAVAQTADRPVVLYDLATGRALWSSPVHATSAPEILGDIVVVSSAGNVLGLDLRTGQRRWSADAHRMPLMGAARDGDTIVLVYSLGASGNGPRVGRVTAVDAAGGGERWTHEVVGILGHPAADGGFAFIPWDRQSIAVLDVASGTERARIRTTDDVLSWVFASPQGVFYGSAGGAYRWTPRSASGTREGSAYVRNPLAPTTAADPTPRVPGNPPMYVDAFSPTSGTRTARERIRFAFRPIAHGDDGVAIDRGQIYLIYYRFVIAADAATGQVRWARAIGPDDSASATAVAAAPGGDVHAALEAVRRAQASFSNYDIDAVTVLPDALVIVGGNGRVRALDPSNGAILGGQDLGATLGAINADLTGYHAPATNAAPPPEGDARAQIVALIRDPDNRLVTMRAYLVHKLGQRPEAEATRDLLELYRDHAIPNALRQDIAATLRSRHNGQQFLVAAIDGDDDHYNFLENRAAPPLDVIAPTLAAMGAREAVPFLIAHLEDHETPLASLPAVIDAITQLGDPSVVPELEAYVQQYKADSAFAGANGTPLATAARGIFTLGDAAARQWLTQLSHDQSAHAALRGAVARLFDEERGGQERGSQDQQLAHARETLQGRVNELRHAVSAYPMALTNDAFEAEWNNHLDEVRECALGVLTRRPDLNQIRITVTLRSEPPQDMFRTVPPDERVSGHPTFGQQLHAIEQQTQWVEQHLALLQSHRSTVRTVAYAPQDTQMQQCMNGVIEPVRFAGFGHGTSQRAFSETISTVRTHAQETTTLGFGTPQGGSVVVPWFLVSSPSLDAATGRLVASSTEPATTTGTATTAVVTPTTTHGTPVGNTGHPGTTGAATPADAGVAGPATNPAHPWWE